MYKKINFNKCRSFFIALALFFLFACTACFCACKPAVDYMDYVSELRSNIFLAKTEDFSLRIYAVRKEYPYASDGIPQESSTRLEAYLVAPNGVEVCVFNVTVDGKEYGGEMSFDNVKTEYYFSCTLDVSNATELPCKIRYRNEELSLNAVSVKTNDLLSAKAILTHLQTTEAELFEILTDKYGFTGEIYIRLIYEGSPYYYIGIIDRNSKINAFLLDAKTGKILAKRAS